ncbi:hypothetical protein FZC35_00935 [Candidatus Cytomitobacter indipagum]|uniref:Methyltransferase domain-containing protein n=1 Tax=Candidatus Cytomitobacter indipagum TaxID=2601575 RepID=A0A5C0UD37_9PROT|nr:rRNA adenine N-6-methyltransferase family protein [Candidatus Cytomitobacter indipagum]QEK37946.1 hypothetical protein FZC35_00935 [Candidatus Cytomitobacter indipagum]
MPNIAKLIKELMLHLNNLKYLIELRMSKKVFFKKWISNPFRMGSIIPSSSGIGFHFAKNIDLNKPGPIIEVGSGTGTVTEALIKSGVPEDRIICFEIEKDFCDILKKKFPKASVYNADILEIENFVDSKTQINSFISTLPFVSLGKQKTDEIMRLFKKFVDEGSDYLQMSYSPFFNSKAKKHGISSRRCSYVLRNFPPAYLYLCNNQSF